MFQCQRVGPRTDPWQALTRCSSRAAEKTGLVNYHTCRVSDYVLGKGATAPECSPLEFFDLLTTSMAHFHTSVSLRHPRSSPVVRAGGVAVSGLEMAQNSQRFPW